MVESCWNHRLTAIGKDAVSDISPPTLTAVVKKLPKIQWRRSIHLVRSISTASRLRNCSVRGGRQLCILCWEGPSGCKDQAREISKWEKDQCWGYRGDERSMIQSAWEKCTHGKSRIKMVITVGFSKCVSWRQWEGGEVHKVAGYGEREKKTMLTASRRVIDGMDWY